MAAGSHCSAATDQYSLTVVGLGGLRSFAIAADSSCVGVESRHSTEGERGHHAALPHDRGEPISTDAAEASDDRYGHCLATTTESIARKNAPTCDRSLACHNEIRRMGQKTRFYSVPPDRSCANISALPSGS